MFRLYYDNCDSCWINIRFYKKDRRLEKIFHSESVLEVTFNLLIGQKINFARRFHKQKLRLIHSDSTSGHRYGKFLTFF